MNNLESLLNTKFVTSEELELIEEDENVLSVEDNGMSGKNLGYHWYTVMTKEKNIYDIYCKY